ncbi:hypothetical protein LJK87_06090 [Paenibacillus sp. P25]|nr:hypothetical protein LJK87_06090 [Paenibacillus sp. P25]
MYLGQIVEIAERDRLFDSPRHPYTQAPLSSVPEPGAELRRERILLRGEVPNAADPPPGLPVPPPRPHAEERRRKEKPALREWAAGHSAACHLLSS